MAIGYDFIVDLEKLKADGYIRSAPRVLELGAQQLHPDFFMYPEHIDQLYRAFGVSKQIRAPKKVEAEFVHGVMKHLNEDAPYARAFYESLGFKYTALEIDGHGDAISLDLNFESAPTNLAGQFDLVTNFGTTEHVCNQLNAFRVMHDFTRSGGLMYHNLPMSGFFNHGLFNYNPKFFWMLCRANNYQLVFLLVGAGQSPYALPDNIVQTMGQFAPRPNWLDDYRIDDLGLKVVMRKTSDAPFAAPLDVSDEFYRTMNDARRRYVQEYRLRGNSLFDKLKRLVRA